MNDYIPNNKMAILIQCHTNPEQVNLLLAELNHPQIDCFVHVDKKSNITDRLCASKNVFILPDSIRVDVQWGNISQVDATLNLLRTATAGNYDYYILISGQDWPVRPMNELIKLCGQKENRLSLWPSLNYNDKFNHFDKRNSIYYPFGCIGRNKWQRIFRRLYVEISGGYNHTFKLFRRSKYDQFRFYFGSSWWGLTGETVTWIMDYLDKNPFYYTYFSNSTCPDESFFQTLVMMSPFSEYDTHDLTYARFSPGANNPDWLLEEDLKNVYDSDFLFMRKIDLKKIPYNILTSLK